LFKQPGKLAALRGGEVGAKAAADRLPVHRPGAPQRVSAGRGERGEAGPAVGLVGLALGSRGLLTGALTIRGVTRPVTLAAEYLGHVADPWGGQRAVFTAEGTLNREDWGLAWNMPLDGGGLLVSKEIRIEINAEAVLQPAAPPA